jgi:hypothetical protein
LNQLFYKFLGVMAPIFDLPRLAWANRGIRKFLLKLFIPWLERSIQRACPQANTLRLVCRHSVKEDDSYNFLFSDLDLSVILNASQLSLAPEIRKILNQRRRLFIFIGEVEIYSSDELVAVEDLRSPIQAQASFLRNMRKIGWIEDGLENHSAAYHRKKALRALNKIFFQSKASFSGKSFNNIQDYNKPLFQFLSQFSEVRSEPLSFKIFVNYLGFVVSQGNFDLGPKERGLHLPGNLGLLLLAIVPFRSTDLRLQAAIERLRQSSQIFPLWKSLVEIEVFTLNAVYRGDPDQFSWMPPWIDELKKMRQQELATFDFSNPSL